MASVYDELHDVKNELNTEGHGLNFEDVLDGIKELVRKTDSLYSDVERIMEKLDSVTDELCGVVETLEESDVSDLDIKDIARQLQSILNRLY